MVVCKSLKKTKCKKLKCSWINESKRRFCRKPRRKKNVAIIYPGDIQTDIDKLKEVFNNDIEAFKNSINESAKINEFSITNISRFRNFNNLIKYLKKIGWETEMYIDPGNYHPDISRIYIRC